MRKDRERDKRSDGNKSHSKGKPQTPNTKHLTQRDSSKNQRRAKEVEDTAAKMSTTNDYSWYSKFPQFSRDAATLPFSTVVGNPVSVLGAQVNPRNVLAYTYIPTIGYSADLSSPFNRSLVRFHTYLRSVQKAASTYDGQDIGMVLMAIDSLYSYHEFLVRAYRVCQLYTPVNVNYPDTLLRAMGINPGIKLDLARFRSYINQLGINLTQFILPKDFDINARHSWMNSGLYLDSNTTRAAVNLFVPMGFWRFNQLAETGSELIWAPWLAVDINQREIALATLDMIISYGNALLNAVAHDNDVAQILGDLYIAYGRNGVKQVAEVNDLDAILPVYDPVVLSQMENATLVGDFSDSFSKKITQNPSVNNGAVLFTPLFTGTRTVGYETPAASYATWYPDPGLSCSGNLLINMHIDSPSPEAIMEATRLMVCMTAQGHTSNYAGYVSDNDAVFSVAANSFGADVVSYAILYPVDRTNDLYIFDTNYYNGEIKAATRTSGALLTDVQMHEQILALSAIDWHFLVYYYTAVGSSASSQCRPFNQWAIRCVNGDIDNYSAITPWQLQQMHEASLLSLFDVPEINVGKLQSSK